MYLRIWDDHLTVLSGLSYGRMHDFSEAGKSMKNVHISCNCKEDQLVQSVLVFKAYFMVAAHSFISV